MATRATVTLIDRQVWLDQIGEQLRQCLQATLERLGPAGQEVSNVLHGTWLGHPLHPAVTDVPLGAWTAALVFDSAEVLAGRRTWAVGADAAVAVGLAGAAGAALTGLADWRHTDGSAARVGLAHGLLNTGAALLYGTSLVARARGARGAGRAWAALGYATAAAAAYLGGELVYGQQVGVDHARRPTPTEEFEAVLPEGELPEGQVRRVEVQGIPVLLVRQQGRLFALGDVCSHLGGPLSEGPLRDGSVVCPWHGSCFALADGRVLDGPATFPQPVFEARVRDGSIEVRPSPSPV